MSEELLRSYEKDLEAKERLMEVYKYDMQYTVINHQKEIVSINNKIKELFNEVIELNKKKSDFETIYNEKVEIIYAKMLLLDNEISEKRSSINALKRGSY